MDPRAERMFELMKKESNRLKTFQMNPPWPKDYVDIKKLAKAGFFYVFHCDNVICAFCRGQVCRWDRDDDPLTEHSRHFTTCPFIMGGDVGNIPLGDDPFPGPKRPRPYDVCGLLPNFPPNDPRSQESPNEVPTVPESASHDEHHSAIESDANRNPNNNYQHQPIDQSSLVIQNPAQNQSSLVPPQPAVVPPQTNEVSSLSSSMNPTSQFREESAQVRPNIASVASCSDAQSNNLNGICKICYTNSIELVFLPCGHSVSCLSCAQRLFSCPCCREPITTRIRIYMV